MRSKLTPKHPRRDPGLQLFRICKVCQREIPEGREGETCSDACMEYLRR